MKTILAIAVMASCALGCGGGSAEGEPEYTGCGTDEIWRTFDDQERVTAPLGSPEAPVVTAPAAGATVPFATPPTLAWQPSATDGGAADGDVQHDGPGCDNCCPQWTRGGLGTQHAPPISGYVYDLRFSADGAEVWRVVTTLQRWAPNPTTQAWARMRKKTVSLVLWRMWVRRNEPRQGPFAAPTPFTFTVGE